MRFVLLGVIGLLTFSNTAGAQDLPTTHDVGITITPDHLTDAIQETQDYWGPVRKHLLGNQCTLGAPEPRSEAVAYLKTVHDGLHERLFNRTEADAMDLITFLSHRLRMFEVYRRLRTTLADDALTLTLLQAFQQDLREANKLPAADREAALAASAARLNAEMQRHGVTGEKLIAAEELWKTQLQVMQLIAATDAGKMMVDYELQATKLHSDVGLVLLYISTASDWVLIVRESGRPIGCDDFLKALAEVESVNAKRTAALSGAIDR